MAAIRNFGVVCGLLIGATILCSVMVESRVHFHRHHRHRTTKPPIHYHYVLGDSFRNINTYQSVYNVSSEIVMDCNSEVGYNLCLNTTALCLANGYIFCTTTTTVECKTGQCVTTSVLCSSKNPYCKGLTTFEFPCVSQVNIIDDSKPTTPSSPNSTISLCATLVATPKRNT